MSIQWNDKMKNLPLIFQLIVIFFFYRLYPYQGNLKLLK